MELKGFFGSSSVDPDQTAHKEQSDQGLHCLPFHHHFFRHNRIKRGKSFHF